MNTAIKNKNENLVVGVADLLIPNQQQCSSKKTYHESYLGMQQQQKKNNVLLQHKKNVKVSVENIELVIAYKIHNMHRLELPK